MEDHKLEIIAEDLHDNPDYMMPLSAQSFYLGFMEFARDNAEIEKHAAGLLEEYKAGAAIDVTWVCVVGRLTS